MNLDYDECQKGHHCKHNENNEICKKCEHITDCQAHWCYCDYCYCCDCRKILKYPCNAKCCNECVWFYEDKRLKGNCRLYQFYDIDKNIKNCNEG